MYPVRGSIRIWTLVLLIPNPHSCPLSTPFCGFFLYSLTAALRGGQNMLLAICILFYKLRYNLQTVNQDIDELLKKNHLCDPYLDEDIEHLQRPGRSPLAPSQSVIQPSYTLKWPCFWVTSQRLVLLVLGLHVNGTIRYELFSVWLLFFNINSVRFTCDTTGINGLSPFIVV